MTIPTGSESKLFQPIKIADGKITLKHRVIFAPLTRNRGTPYNTTSTAENPNRLWYPNELMAEYYRQRTTEGGLLISEGIPMSLESNGMPGVPGLFLPEQAEGWKKVVEAVHEKGGFIYCQLWHAGRANIPQMSGLPVVCPSATHWDDPNECYNWPPVGSTKQIRYADFPPIELTIPHLKQQIQDFCNEAKLAMEIGFDGVELHAGNGYLPEQFLSSNINKRTDEYGGTNEKRCNFVLELMDQLAKTVGEENLAIRLSPFGLFNQTRSEQRMETWSYLSRCLKQNHPRLSYVSFIEPRYDQIFTPAEKAQFLKSWNLANITLSPFRAIFGSTPFFSGGGWDDTNSWEAIASGDYDALLFGRWYISNPDLVERLKLGKPLNLYDRGTFYGPFERNERGYTDYPTMLEKEPARAVVESL
ncbi:MAG: hypothetical protein M1812_006563 [Candelaria pacifica]|nr:MAG: hypothetical protein M1812_006563 [Candelaria pacifica]